MSKFSTGYVLMVLLVLVAGTTACISKHQLPLIDGKETVAMVNGEPITREEYEQEISSMHFSSIEEQKAGEQKTDKKKPGKVDYAGIMKRIIDAKLIKQEAKNIGLNELPEVRESVEGYSRKTLRTVLIYEHTKGVKPDEAVVDKLYKKATAEWKFAAAMFAKEDDARKMEAEIRAGKNFIELTEKAIAAGQAKGGKAEGYFKDDTISPGISDALLTMTTGSVSPIISLPAGFALLKLEDARYKESPEEKESARAEALQIQRGIAKKEFIESLLMKYVKINQELLDSLDYGSSLEKFEALLKNERVIAEIEGEDPVKVSDLSDEIRRKYFHGIDKALGKKNLNAKKQSILEEIIEKRVLLKEASVRDIKKTASYQKLVKNYEDAILFDLFIGRIIVPEVTVMESEIKAYYDKHHDEYTSPELIRLDGVIFKKRTDAEEAMRKLRAGDQLSWIKSNAEGQVEKDAERILALGGNVFARPELDEGLKAALSGAGAGDVRLYESPEGFFYVISVVAVYPPETQDYLSIREPVAKQLFNEHVQAGVADWVEKLRKIAEVKVYLED